MGRHPATISAFVAYLLLLLVAPYPAHATLFVSFASQTQGYGIGCITPSPGGFGPTPQAADTACVDTESGGQAKASASFGHVGALAQQQQTSDFTILHSQYEADAEYHDTVVFTDP